MPNTRLGRSTSRMTLGNAGKVTAEAARRAARAAFAKVASGHDPANEKAVRKAEAAHTFGAVIKTLSRSRRPTFAQAAWRRFRSTCAATGSCCTASPSQASPAPMWPPQPALSLRGAVRRRSRPLGAVFLFSWAMGEGLCQHNPVVGTNKAAPAVSRDRVIDAETIAVWNAANAGDFGKIVPPAVPHWLPTRGDRRAAPVRDRARGFTDCVSGEPHQERVAARCATQRAC